MLIDVWVYIYEVESYKVFNHSVTCVYSEYDPISICCERRLCLSGLPSVILYCTSCNIIPEINNKINHNHIMKKIESLLINQT